MKQRLLSLKLLPFILLLALEGVLSSCVPSSEETKAKLGFNFNFAMSSDSTHLRVFARKKEETLHHSLANDIPSTGQTLSLTNGEWKFYSVEWTGTQPYTGHLRCAVTPNYIKLEGGIVQIELDPSEANCGDLFFDGIFDNFCFKPNSSDNGLFRKGAGTPLDPYLICNLTQLNALSKNFERLKDKSFALIKDIYFYGSFGDPQTPLPFFMIGEDLEESPQSSSAFTGTFEGNNYALRGLTLKIPSSASQTAPYSSLGFIRHLGTQGVVKNLRFILPELRSPQGLESYSQVGTVAGFSRGLIQNVQISYGHIEGKRIVGGLVGQLDPPGKIQHSFFLDGEVKGSSQLGGLIGLMNAPQEKERLFQTTSSGKIEGLEEKIGGLVGEVTGNCSGLDQLTQNKSQMDVQGLRKVGGLVGLLGAECLITNSYASGDIKGREESSSLGGLVGHLEGQLIHTLRFGGGVTPLKTQGIGIITGTGKLSNCQSSFAHQSAVGLPLNCSGFESATLNYIALRSLGTYLSNTDPWSMSSDLSSSHIWKMDDEGQDTPRLSFEKTRACQGKFSRTFAGGTGAEEDPFLICSKNQWDNIASYPFNHFKLISDIDLAGTLSNGAYFNFNFGGKLDGNAHKVSNLTASGNSSVALFKELSSGGALKNIALTSATVLSSSMASSLLVGKNYGLIDGVFAEGLIEGNAHVGILAGENYGTIVYSQGNGTIKGNQIFGGLVGLNGVGGIIKRSDSHSYLKIEGPYAIESVGGLVGKNSGTIEESSSHSDLFLRETTNATSKIGGFIGHNLGSVSNSFSEGSLSEFHSKTLGAIHVGGFVGYDEGYINKSYSSLFWNHLGQASLISSGSWGPFAGGPKTLNYPSSFILGSSVQQGWGNLIGWNTITFANTYSLGTTLATSGDITLYQNVSWDISNNWNPVEITEGQNETQNRKNSTWVLPQKYEKPRLRYSEQNEEHELFFRGLLGF